MKLFITLLIGWNIITFAMMGIDKRKAIKNRQRISEKNLILCGILLGAYGMAAGAAVFHHKTKKMLFRVMIPVSLIADTAAIFAAIYYILKL